MNANQMRSILIFRFCVGVAGIACVAIGVTFLLAGEIGSLPGLLFRGLAGLERLHLARNRVCENY